MPPFLSVNHSHGRVKESPNWGDQQRTAATRKHWVVLCEESQFWTEIVHDLNSFFIIIDYQIINGSSPLQ